MKVVLLCAFCFFIALCLVKAKSEISRKHLRAALLLCHVAIYDGFTIVGGEEGLYLGFWIEGLAT